MTESITTIADLLTPQAVRRRCSELLTLGDAGKLAHFRVARERFQSTVDYVYEVMKGQYPTFAVPYHSRLRHLSAGGVNRIRMLDDRMMDWEDIERLKTWCDLVIVSVLMDAGAGPQWRYREIVSGKEYDRSEGLAVASFDLFVKGWFSAEPTREPFRIDGSRLEAITVDELALVLQVSDKNQLVGLEGRAKLMNALGRVVSSHRGVFGSGQQRLGNMMPWLIGRAKKDGVIPAAQVLTNLLRVFGPIWPGRVTIDGLNLGDTWPHSAIGGAGITRGLVPFHKLSQWLSYSMIEVLERGGHTVSAIDELTGLAEYRNGGLLIDSGLLVLKDPAAAKLTHDPGDELIVEWRALTVALLDEIAAGLRTKLGLSTGEFPLAKALEGGTWHAGRRIAKERRPDGGPPLLVTSDGTVF